MREWRRGSPRLGYVGGKNIDVHRRRHEGDRFRIWPPGRRSFYPPSLTCFSLFPRITRRRRSTRHLRSRLFLLGWVMPIQAGLIDSYPYSKSNLTGVTAIGDSLSGKRLEVLLEIAPKAKRLLVIVAAKESVSVSSFRSLEVAAQKFGIQLVRRDVTDKEEITKALEETPRGSVDAIFHVPSTLVRTNLDLIVDRAKRDKIPLAVHEETLLDQGALFSYGPNTRLVGLQAANLDQQNIEGNQARRNHGRNPRQVFSRHQPDYGKTNRREYPSWNAGAGGSTHAISAANCRKMVRSFFLAHGSIGGVPLGKSHAPAYRQGQETPAPFVRAYRRDGQARGR